MTDILSHHYPKSTSWNRTLGPKETMNDTKTCYIIVTRKNRN